MDLGAWGIVIGVIGIGLAVVFHYRREVQPRLTYRIGHRPLLGGVKLNTKDLEVWSGENLVSEPWIWEAAFTNTGKGPIRPADFDPAVYFRFASSAQFLQVEAVGSPKAYIKDHEENHSFMFGIAPQVINPGESVEIVALTDGPVDAGPPRGKIAGVQRIRLVGDDPPTIENALQPALIAVLVATIVLLIWLAYEFGVPGLGDLF